MIDTPGCIPRRAARRCRSGRSGSSAPNRSSSTWATVPAARSGDPGRRQARTPGWRPVARSRRSTGHRQLVVPVAMQVQAAAVPHERAEGLTARRPGVGNHRRSHQGVLPPRLGRPRQRIGLVAVQFGQLSRHVGQPPAHVSEPGGPGGDGQGQRPPRRPGRAAAVARWRRTAPRRRRRPRPPRTARAPSTSDGTVAGRPDATGGGHDATVAARPSRRSLSPTTRPAGSGHS